jgi:hypothetical protein
VSNRNLVPMPTRRTVRTEHLAPLKTWHCFAWLVVTAIVYYYLGKLILFVAAIVLLVNRWVWFCRRYPRTAWSLRARITGRSSSDQVTVMRVMKRLGIADQ